ncbi:hypothetical protein D037_3796B, partial [Vibrio parahaemolyticus IDH02640]
LLIASQTVSSGLPGSLSR